MDPRASKPVQAKLWIGNIFQRFGSSRKRKESSQLRQIHNNNPSSRNGSTPSTRSSMTTNRHRCGRIQLSLQHFPNSRQLRVIILRADIDLDDNCVVFAKAAMVRNNSVKRRRTKKEYVKNRQVQFNKYMYMKTKSDDLCGYSLRIKLCKESTLFRRSSVLGQSTIDLEGLDISFDTTLWLTLQDSSSSNQEPFDENLEITSETRSIQDEARLSLKVTDELTLSSLALNRCLSFPRTRLNRYKASSRKTRSSSTHCFTDKKVLHCTAY